MKRSLFVAATLAVSLAVGASAHAQGNVDRAKALFDGGAAMYDKAHYEEAIQAFEAAYQIAPRTGILFSIAQAHKKQFFFDKNPEHLREALRAYREYAEKTPNGGRRAEAVASIAELEPYTARFDMSKIATPAAASRATTTILVQANVQSLEVVIDGKKSPEDTMHWAVAPGKHKVSVSAPGFAPQEQEVTVSEGEYRPVLFTLKELPALLSIDTEPGAQVSIDGRLTGQTPLLRPLDIEPGTHLVTVAKNGYRGYSEETEFHHGETRALTVPLKRTGQRYGAYVLFGAGAAAAIAGGVFAGVALHDQVQAQHILDLLGQGTISAKQQTEYQNYVNAREDWKKVAGVTFGGAAIAGATGLVLYAFDQPVIGQAAQHRDDKKTPGPLPILRPGHDLDISFAPSIGPGFQGGALLGRF
jgi:hypothetical protein